MKTTEFGEEILELTPEQQADLDGAVKNVMAARTAFSEASTMLMRTERAMFALGNKMAGDRKIKRIVYPDLEDKHKAMLILEKRVEVV